MKTARKLSIWNINCFDHSPILWKYLNFCIVLEYSVKWTIKKLKKNIKHSKKTLSDTESRDFESVELLEKTKIVVPKKHQPNWGRDSFEMDLWLQLGRTFPNTLTVLMIDILFLSVTKREITFSKLNVITHYSRSKHEARKLKWFNYYFHWKWNC